MGLNEAALGHQGGASPSAWHSGYRAAYCVASLREATRDRLGARRGDSHEAIVISANEMDAALSAGELACQLPPWAWLPSDAIAGITLAAYAIPVSLAYAGLAGLPPQVGIYGYLLGGVGYAFLGSSRQLAIGPTSAISLMIAGTVGEMAGVDMHRYCQVASA